jgi:hypothetical protein
LKQRFPDAPAWGQAASSAGGTVTPVATMQWRRRHIQNKYSCYSLSCNASLWRAGPTSQGRLCNKRTPVRLGTIYHHHPRIPPNMTMPSRLPCWRRLRLRWKPISLILLSMRLGCVRRPMLRPLVLWCHLG